MKYSPGFRASIVRKTQDGCGRSINQLAKETGISYSTISNWIEQYRTGKLSLDDADGVPPPSSLCVKIVEASIFKEIFNYEIQFSIQRITS